MKTYAVKHKDEKVICDSRSGGIFTAIAEKVLSQSGVVYGCILNDKCVAIHSRAVNMNEVKAMRGSKYVQSYMGDCFKQVENDLQEGRRILFSGTSCQITGLRMVLQKEYMNLLCVDIVCHGVPSPKLWKNYLEWQAQGKTVQSVDFRNKQKYGWRDHVETVKTEQGEKDSKVWTNVFYSGNALRPSCYECPYKSVNHPGDITIADYWGIEKAAPEFDDNKGVSLVLVNTDKGAQIFEEIKENIRWKETKIEDSMQRAFIRPELRPKTREQFWNDVERKDFSYIAQKYGGLTPLWRKAARKVKNILKSLIGKK